VKWIARKNGGDCRLLGGANDYAAERNDNIQARFQRKTQPEGVASHVQAITKVNIIAQALPCGEKVI
jgi:hypothetical protein